MLNCEKNFIFVIYSINVIFRIIEFLSGKKKPVTDKFYFMGHQII